MPEASHTTPADLAAALGQNAQLEIRIVEGDDWEDDPTDIVLYLNEDQERRLLHYLVRGPRVYYQYRSGKTGHYASLEQAAADKDTHQRETRRV